MKRSHNFGDKMCCRLDVLMTTRFIERAGPLKTVADFETETISAIGI